MQRLFSEICTLTSGTQVQTTLLREGNDLRAVVIVTDEDGELIEQRILDMPEEKDESEGDEDDDDDDDE